MLSKNEIDKIVHSAHQDPFEVLGAHKVRSGGKGAVAVRAFLPEAIDASVLRTDTAQICPMKKLHPDGFFEVVAKDVNEIFHTGFGSCAMTGANGVRGSLFLPAGAHRV